MYLRPAADRRGAGRDHPGAAAAGRRQPEGRRQAESLPGARRQAAKPRAAWPELAVRVRAPQRGPASRPGPAAVACRHPSGIPVAAQAWRVRPAARRMARSAPRVAAARPVMAVPKAWAGSQASGYAPAELRSGRAAVQAYVSARPRAAARPVAPEGRQRAAGVWDAAEALRGAPASGAAEAPRPVAVLRDAAREQRRAAGRRDEAAALRRAEAPQRAEVPGARAHRPGAMPDVRARRPAACHPGCSLPWLAPSATAHCDLPPARAKKLLRVASPSARWSQAAPDEALSCSEIPGENAWQHRKIYAERFGESINS